MMNMVETPVLYITFARPEYASQSFAAIKAAKPKKLYFYSNKARDDKPDEVKRNLEIRSYISQINWECEVITWFREEYVDVYTSLWGAIDWFFDNEERGIVIEEDCKASRAFFDYVDKLLPKYECNQRVWLISGDNFTPQYNPSNLDYFFSKNIHIYGWGSWRDRWKSMDREMKDWPTIKNTVLKKYYANPIEYIWRKKLLNRVFCKMDKFYPWDFVFEYNVIVNNGLAVIPCINMVEDIGVSGVHHTVQLSMSNPVDFDKKEFPINKEPIAVEACSKYDFLHFFSHIMFPTIKRRLKKYVQFK